MQHSSDNGNSNADNNLPGMHSPLLDLTIPGWTSVLQSITEDYPASVYDLSLLTARLAGLDYTSVSSDELLSALIKVAVELTSPEAPDWEFIAGRLLDFQLHRRITTHATMCGLHTFADKVRFLTNEGLYGNYILENYTDEELEEAARYMRPERNRLFNYSGLDLLAKRYLIRTHNHQLIETPQEDRKAHV